MWLCPKDGMIDYMNYRDANGANPGWIGCFRCALLPSDQRGDASADMAGAELAVSAASVLRGDGDGRQAWAAGVQKLWKSVLQQPR